MNPELGTPCPWEPWPGLGERTVVLREAIVELEANEATLHEILHIGYHSTSFIWVSDRAHESPPVHEDYCWAGLAGYWGPRRGFYRYKGVEGEIYSPLLWSPDIDEPLCVDDSSNG